jgi:hypothetical protein
MMQSPSVFRQHTKPYGQALSPSVMPVPDGTALVVPQYQRIDALHDFPRQDELAPSCITLEPVKAISAPLLKLTPMSLRNDSGQR